MLSYAAVLLTASAILGQAQAEEVCKSWWKFMEGEWTYVIDPIGDKGTATWRISAKGHALVGRFKGDDGELGIELSGWQSDSKTELATGFGSAGDYWTLLFTKQRADTCEAHNTGMLPDGTKYEGKFVGRRVDDNHYEWQFKGKTAAGKELTMTGKYTRKGK